MIRIEKTGIINIIIILLLFVSLYSYGQDTHEKTLAIISKLDLVESQKLNFEYQLEPLKYQATGNDSISLIEIEKKLNEEEITKRITTAFEEIFNDEEINDIYNFIQTSSFEKFFNSGETYKVISTKFSDINNEIERITNNFNETVEKPNNKFEPIPVDREDGFYAMVDYGTSAEFKYVTLEEKPSLTKKDISKVKKASNNDRMYIDLTLTKEGAKKFYILTKNNISKPVAIVIEKHIVSLPIVNSEIIGGKVSISGDFSEKEIDKMIEKLKEK